MVDFEFRTDIYVSYVQTNFSVIEQSNRVFVTSDDISKGFIINWERGSYVNFDVKYGILERYLDCYVFIQITEDLFIQITDEEVFKEKIKLRKKIDELIKKGFHKKEDN